MGAQTLSRSVSPLRFARLLNWLAVLVLLSLGVLI